jgi:hypothetical protein
MFHVELSLGEWRLGRRLRCVFPAGEEGRHVCPGVPHMLLRDLRARGAKALRLRAWCPGRVVLRLDGDTRGVAVQDTRGERLVRCAREVELHEADVPHDLCVQGRPSGIALVPFPGCSSSSCAPAVSPRSRTPGGCRTPPLGCRSTWRWRSVASLVEYVEELGELERGSACRAPRGRAWG